MQHVRVVVIGGGATGTGILRDLSMRGIPALLVEKADLASGTSSRFHGLLHSGARYAVNDPEAAKECIRENTILRRIGKSCVEETEGYFVRTPGDDPAFEPRWIAACRACGIEVEEVPLAEALRREPNLSPDAEAVYRVPDSAVDGFRLVWHNVMSARRYGGAIRTYCQVVAINSVNGAVTGVTLQNGKTGEKETVPCEMVINATGSWAGEVASLAGIAVSVSPDRGTLLAFNHRFTNRVVNRLRKSSDGDIFVPHGSIVIFGTTSIPTDRPDDTRPRSEDVLYLLKEGEPLFPKIRDYRMLRAFAGTRPLYSPSAATGRAATRNFVIIDHEEEGLSGLLTVTGGKFTSFRLMAEKTVDKAAAKLGVTAPCRTAEESIVPAPDEHLMKRATKLFPSEGTRLAVSRLGDDLELAVRASEENPWKKLLLCECEMVTLAEFETVASEPTSHSLGDIRRRTRLGMGTCQGSFCALRATGALVENALIPDASPRALFRQFLQERWGGIRPLLWGTQLKEIELERGIYDATLNIDGHSEGTFPPCEEPQPFHPVKARTPAPAAPNTGDGYDAVVVGAGFSGLIAAATAAGRGKRVLVINRGGGALTIGGGTVDILGFAGQEVVTGNPFAAMERLAPGHPYRIVGPEAVRDALDFLADVMERQGGAMLRAGSETTGNAWLPTAAGTMKPTWITGQSMNPATVREAESFVVVGITGMKDFSPQLAASGLQLWPQFAGKRLEHKHIPSPFGEKGVTVRDTTALDLASFLDSPEGFDWLERSLAGIRSDAACILLPTILGTKPGSAVHARLEQATKRKIVELFCPPPSVTGLRMHRALMQELRLRGVHFVENATVTKAVIENGRCRALVTAMPDKEREYRADSFIIATGGLFSEGVKTRPGEATEAIFKLPIPVPPVQDDWSSPEFFGHGNHPFAVLGVAVNGRLNPLGPGAAGLWDNVHFVGRSLGGYDFASEKSGSGVALATGHFAGTLV
ncbi:sn-glycerol-3-phosphate dehydrogenase (anaerobic), large subunit, FAD/NAD(P)-binding (modular protein) [uncultured delta proteobacterium]|uniref:sn-glycerol-3-phosphate dehydrogenase (Anaerobic), large subunit, FAD/NAD(P)-binding (Modular protein) n=1 Tax=uncultured delta proteobacterium TaxID=34034 RepID=A0A212IUD6_9DELT|nr:sn-glycerol-3-phosphate dehydrogenase (anaerobic), large subunit, FAD/NAD(P)-binding (modular protein) [uncultured delta proteobacterium]